MNTTGANDLIIYPISESAVTIEFGHAIDEALLPRITGFNRLICQSPFPGLVDTVPAYTTLSVFFDPVQVFNHKGLPGNTCFEKVSGYLRQLKEDKHRAPFFDGVVISIPVCYGGALGPDLEDVAVYHQLSTDEVIALHSAAIYTVFMIGFIPGFAYMGGLNDLLETPRRASPRKAVPAGAVGIAGKQTGIYPLQTPGGWQIIGQTPLKLFDIRRNPPGLLKAGNRIKFEPMNPADFENQSVALQ
jgi:inhibitor of KinA